jgi:glycosyltransferase involved in cell wall biosynthesis
MESPITFPYHGVADRTRPPGAMPALTLVIAVYNKPEILRMVLAGVARQVFRDFEVIVADDGSGPEIADVVEEARRADGLRIEHLWHEDRGWRKNVMLNKAVRAAAADYLVFIDGDCIPARHFLLDHWNEREPRTVLMGRRVEMSRRWGSAMTVEKVRSGEFERFGWREVKESLFGESLRNEDAVRLPSPLIRRLLKRNVRTLLGCNFSAWKSDVENINGFDEEYDGPGWGEDADVQYRFSLAGVTGKSMRNVAVQYHLWHPQTRPSEKCRTRFEMVERSGRSRCAKGLVQVDA